MKIKDLEVTRHKLTEPLTIKAQPEAETYIHPLIGSGMIEFEGKHAVQPIGGRANVFQAPGRGVLFSGYGITIYPNETLDVLVISVGNMPGRFCDPTWINPKRHEIGHSNHRRTVYEILGGDGPALRLRCGETVNEKGAWSSWPPHSFDHNTENAPRFEEVFIPFLRPKTGMALMQMKGTFHDGDKIDGAISLVSGEMVSVPLGEHPIVGGPDTDLMYFWAYVSPEPKKYGTWAEDVGTYA